MAESQLSYSNNTSGRSRTLHPHVLAALREGGKIRGRASLHGRRNGHHSAESSAELSSAGFGWGTGGEDVEMRAGNLRGPASGGGREWGGAHLELPDRAWRRGATTGVGGVKGRRGGGQHTLSVEGGGNTTRGWVMCKGCGDRHHWHSKCKTSVLPLSVQDGEGGKCSGVLHQVQSINFVY